MRKYSGILPLAALVAFGGAVAFMPTGAAAQGGEEYQVVSDLDAFKARFIGPKIMDPADDANYFVINEDGTLKGTWHGAELAGEWRWEDGYFCRSLSSPRPAPEDCQQWGVADGKARLVRNRGEGDATFYALGQ